MNISTLLLNSYLFSLVVIASANIRPFISYAALGDSYASGNGAGSPQEITCGRFSEAYPVQIARQMTLAFRNLACAGALMATVEKTQVPWVADSEVVTLQIGGNEADFFSLLNECVQQWYPLSTCEQEIEKAESILQSDSFIDKFESLISNTKRSLPPDTLLFVLGYARFFNDQTEQCNHLTFSRTDPENFLTQEKRLAFNRIVDMLNTILKGVAEAHGARYVDIDALFEGHRFCEDGVVNPTEKSWFFNEVSDLQEVSTELQVNRDVWKQGPGDFLELTRTFHPTIAGHNAMAQEVVGILRRLQNAGKA